jgi:CubicO group peptidase (beta-lactamase class C family)
MHRYPVLLLLSSALTVFGQDARRMQQIAESHVAEKRFMGAVLVAKDDDVLFERGFGWANLEWNIPNAPNTRFRIGSITKQFTAAAILLLEERGKLRIEDPVSKHLPDSPDAWKDVTLFHLLTHTSGIPSFTSFPDYPTLKLAATTVDKTVARFRDKPLEFAPGERHVYSNSGYLLLGHLIEIISGQSYDAFLADNIFKPLGMGDTGIDSNLELIVRRASGYVPSGPGMGNAPYVDMTIPHGAGVMYSTPRDLWKWQQGLYGGKLLSAKSLEKMVTPFKGSYALGLGVSSSPRKMFSHGGGIEGFNSNLAYFPDEKLSVVVLANVNGPTAGELTQQLAKIAFGETVILAAERKELEVPTETLKGYVGTYQLTSRIKNMIRLVDGKLTTQLSGQAQIPLFAESESKFFLKVVDAQVEFIREGGKVTHLLQHQGGRTQKAQRISDTVEERQAITLPRATLERYVGTYEVNERLSMTAALDGDQLTMQLTGQGKNPMFPESETKFFLKVVDAEFEFQKDESGAITHAIIRQGGRELRGKRK